MTTHKKAKSKEQISRFTLPVDDNLAYNVWVGHHRERIGESRECLVLETKALDSHGLVTDEPAAKRDVLITLRLHGPMLYPDSVEIEATPFYHCGLHYKMTRHMKTTRRAVVKSTDVLEMYLRGVTQLLKRLEPCIPVTSGGYAKILFNSDSNFFTVTEVVFPLSVIASVAQSSAGPCDADEGHFHCGYGRSDLVDGYWFRWEIASGSKILKRLSSLLLCNNGMEDRLT